MSLQIYVAVLHESCPLDEFLKGIHEKIDFYDLYYFVILCGENKRNKIEMIQNLYHFNFVSFIFPA